MEIDVLRWREGISLLQLGSLLECPGIFDQIAGTQVRWGISTLESEERLSEWLAILTHLTFRRMVCQNR